MVKILNNIDGRDKTYECQTHNFINKKDTGKLELLPELDEGRTFESRA
jgi:hypothetical protein